MSLFGHELAAQSGDRVAIFQGLIARIIVTTTTGDRSDIAKAGSVVELRKNGLVMYGVASPLPPSNTYKDGKISQGWGGFGKSLLISVITAAGGSSGGYPARNFVAGETCWVTGISVEKDGVTFQLYSDPYDGIRYYADLKIPFPQKKVIPPVDTALQMVAEVLETQQQASPGDEQVPGAATSGNESPPAEGDASDDKPLSIDDILNATAGAVEDAPGKPGKKGAGPSGQTPQSGAKPFTNKDVVALVKAGLGDKNVINKIRSMPGDNLDTSTDALIRLKKAGVSKAVIEAMLTRTGEQAEGARVGGTGATTGSLLVFANSPIDVEIDGRPSGSLSGTPEAPGQSVFTLTPGKHFLKAVSREFSNVNITADVQIREGTQEVVRAMVADEVVRRHAALRANPSAKVAETRAEPVKQASRLERVVPFRTGESIPLGIVEGPVTIKSVQVTGWPKPEKVQKAEGRPDEMTKLTVRFTYANPEKRNWKCMYHVAILDDKGEEVGSGERDADLDKRQASDTNDIDLKMRTLDFPRAAKLSVRVRPRPS